MLINNHHSLFDQEVERILLLESFFNSVKNIFHDKISNREELKKRLVSLLRNNEFKPSKNDPNLFFAPKGDYEVIRFKYKALGDEAVLTIYRADKTEVKTIRRSIGTIKLKSSYDEKEIGKEINKFLAKYRKTAYYSI